MGPFHRSAGIRVGISSCLLGNAVRYDGGHKLDPYLRDTLGALVEWVPVCPEVDAGLPVPREPMRLVGDPGRPRLAGVRTGVDRTALIQAWAMRRLAALERDRLCGFVFKSRSPSSGLRRIAVFGEGGEVVSSDGVGIFAREFVERFPLLPVEDEERLGDLALRERFVERIISGARRGVHLLRGDTPADGLSPFLPAPGRPR